MSALRTKKKRRLRSVRSVLPDLPLDTEGEPVAADEALEDAEAEDGEEVE